MPAGRRIILITGVSRGLGRAMAEEFIRLGNTVIGCGRLEKAIAELKKSFPPPHDFTVCDVSSDEQVAAWAKHVLSNHEPPDLLLNNAALIARNAPLWKVPAREFSEVIDVNIKGVANVIRHFVPAMVVRHSGIIVNFSPTPHSPLYSVDDIVKIFQSRKVSFGNRPPGIRLSPHAFNTDNDIDLVLEILNGKK